MLGGQRVEVGKRGAYFGADASSLAKSSCLGPIFSMMASITKSLDLEDSMASVE